MALSVIDFLMVAFATALSLRHTALALTAIDFLRGVSTFLYDALFIVSSSCALIKYICALRGEQN